MTCSLYVMDGKTMKAYSVHDIVTRSEQLGKAIRNVKNATEGTPEENFLTFSEGIRLFKGKISDVLRTTNGKFNLGRVQLEGIGECKGRYAEVTFQNENLCASVDGLYTRHRAGSYLPGGYGDLHPRHHGRPEVRQARAGGGPEVLPHVAHAQGP